MVGGWGGGNLNFVWLEDSNERRWPGLVACAYPSCLEIWLHLLAAFMFEGCCQAVGLPVPGLTCPCNETKNDRVCSVCVFRRVSNLR